MFTAILTMLVCNTTTTNEVKLTESNETWVIYSNVTDARMIAHSTKAEAMYWAKAYGNCRVVKG